MVNVNHKVKKCPFGLECDECKISMELHKNMAGGLRQNMNTCAFTALVIILSEINMKTQMPMQRINMPKGLIRGNI